MSNWLLPFCLSSLLGYCTGCLNPSYLLAKAKGFDIRSKGSGNAGASNAVISMGKAVGLFCALFDIFKSFLVIKLTLKLFPLFKLAGIAAGACCILGHMFPVTMGFQGGKGLASLGGMILAFSPKLFLILILLEILLAFVTNYICFAATSASQIFTVVLLVQNGLASALLFFPVVLAILARHRKNYIRMRYGVEARFCYLWKKEEEQARIQENWNLLTEEERLLVDMAELEETDAMEAS